MHDLDLPVLAVEGQNVGGFGVLQTGYEEGGLGFGLCDSSGADMVTDARYSADGSDAGPSVPSVRTERLRREQVDAALIYSPVARLRRLRPVIEGEKPAY